jgi:mono/diheme cytochrome c family protein
VFKQTWIWTAVLLALGVALAACGSGDLAEDLTPIPTLPRGEEPELVDALQRDAAPPAEDMTEAPPAGEEVDLVALGEEAFGAACAGCHMAEDGVGPALTGMADRAAERVEGQSAEEYLYESIVVPGAYLVEGYQNIMPGNYGEQYSETELNDLVAYIMEAGSEGAETQAATEEPTEEVEEEAPAEDEAAEDEPAAEDTPDPAVGEELYASACASCHGEEDGVGPALTGMADRAAERVEGQSTEEYLHESIVDPSAYLVESYQDIMPKTYAEQYTEFEINSIVAYILKQ